MKQINCLILLLSFTFVSIARDNSNTISTSFKFSFFKDKYSDNSFNPINPGVEFLYEIGVNNMLTVSSGINYSFSVWKYGDEFFFKRLAHELYFPCLAKIKLNERIFVESGIYTGWLIKGKELYADEFNHHDLRDNTMNTNYHSSPKFSVDLYLGAGINHIVNRKKNIRFIPFIKYKIRDNWMEEKREKTSFGLKINIPILN